MRRSFFKRKQDKQQGLGPRHSRASQSDRGSPVRSNKKDILAEIQSLKYKATRTEELTQRSTRFNFQIAIDMRELMQSEFDALEKQSANESVREAELKMALMELTRKIAGEVENQMEIERRLADAYSRMEEDVVKSLKDLSHRIENSRMAHEDKLTIVQYIGDLTVAVEEACEHWISRPFLGTKRIYEMRRESPKDTQDLPEMFEHIERLLRLCLRTMEHPLSGHVSISKEFLRLNLQYRNKLREMA